MTQKKRTIYWQDILWALVALLPVIILYCCHYFACVDRAQLMSSGFLQTDQPFYMAAAREYWDQETFSLMYSNPSDPSPEAPQVYFQLPILILAMLWKVTGFDPATVFNLFGFISAWLCVMVMLGFWRDFSKGEKKEDLPGLIVFLWGGGLLVLAGLGWSVITGNPGIDISYFDPSRGWWFLNWGRNMVMPLEAFYHLLFICLIRNVYEANAGRSFFFCLLLVLSHPFTGVMAMAIFLVWVVYERIIIHNNNIPVALITASIFIFLADLLYYLVYLPSFPSHQQVFDQWRLNWNLSFVTALLAYSIVGIPAATVLLGKTLKKALTGYDRFLIIMIIISLAFSFNNLVFEGLQPLHFTRGYVWLGFFLAGYPSLKKFFSGIGQYKQPLRLALFSVVLSVAVSDNFLWFFEECRLQLRGKYSITREQNDLLHYLKSEGNNRDLLLSDDYKLGYWAVVYTPLKAVYSHWANTPAALEKAALMNAFRMEGKRHPGWNSQQLFYVQDKNRPVTSQLSDSLDIHFAAVDSSGSFILYRQKILTPH